MHVHVTLIYISNVHTCYTNISSMHTKHVSLLGVKLRGRDMGQPLHSGPKKK